MELEIGLKMKTDHLWEWCFYTILIDNNKKGKEGFPAEKDLVWSLEMGMGREKQALIFAGTAHARSSS